MDCSTRAFCEKACITNILHTRSYAKHAAWGAIDLVFRVLLRTTCIFSFYNKKRFLSLVMTLDDMVFLRRLPCLWSLRTMNDAERLGATLFGTAEKFAGYART
jgi:hypothetical protein